MTFSKQIPVFICAALLFVAAGTTIVRSQSTDATATVAQIDKDCNAIQDAIGALKPIHVVFQSNNWNVVGDKDYTIATQTHNSVTFADVYKQGSNYAWVHAHEFDAKGNQRATQLCFRQSDGTLERVREATTVPDLATATAKQAYYAADGSIIQKTSVFEVDDPMIAKTIKSLPFYSQLPR